MNGDHTAHSTVVVCATCGARVVATTRDAAWSELAAHQVAAGCARARR